MASCSDDYLVKIWNVKTKSLVHSLPLYSIGPPSSLDWDAKYSLLVACNPCTLLWYNLHGADSTILEINTISYIEQVQSIGSTILIQDPVSGVKII